MDIFKLILEFVSTILTSWPSIIFIIFLFLFFTRKEYDDFWNELKKFFNKTSGVSIGSFEIKMESELSETKNEINLTKESINVDKSIANNSSKEFDELVPNSEYVKLARIRPDYAIFDPWKVIETELNLINRSVLKNEKEYLNPGAIINTLLSSNIINQHTFNSIKKLSHIRNEVAHNTSKETISYNQAIEYKDLCKSVFTILNSIKNS